MIDYALKPANCQDFFVGAQKRQANGFETELLKLAAKKPQKRNYSETALNIVGQLMPHLNAAH